MTIENWANPGLPPIDIDVLHRKGDDHEEVVFAKGTLVHLGRPHQGWSGDETIIFRRQKSDGTWFVTKPDPKEYLKQINP